MRRTGTLALITILSCLLRLTASPALGDDATRPRRLVLSDGWQLQSSAIVAESGAQLSTPSHAVKKWLATTVPATVLKTLVAHGVYPDPRIGLNSFQIPDASDAFNCKHDLARFSHLPDHRNPWRDPYWYRTDFNLPAIEAGRRLWLELGSINYRADVWLNGMKVADRDHVVGMFQRFRLEVTAHARPGKNGLAVLVYPVVHPGEPETQLEVFGKDRGYHKEIMKDVTEVMTIGYDCQGTVPDRNMGLIQDVAIEETGPVVIRHPFVVTNLPLPATDHATLTISAELVNASDQPVRGVLHGSVEGTAVRFDVAVELAVHQTRTVFVDPKPVLANPRLWWPAGYGEQSLYRLSLRFEAAGQTSDVEDVSFGVRELSTEMHERNGWHGRRILVNGQKIFCHGGYIQPELLFDWDARRIETELRYYREANLNVVYFEDIPNPPDAFLDACDHLGILFGNCFYACGWPTPGSDHPTDIGLLERCTVDLFKRYRNHPSLVMYMVQNEDTTREDVYRMWRRHYVELDGTRFWIPSGYFPDDRKDVPSWIRPDLPSGMNDMGSKTYSWTEPANYFRWVRDGRHWMFQIENGSPSVPPISSLARFLPDLGKTSAGVPFPLTEDWAHHDACFFFKDYDQALRRLLGEPESVADYCWKGHLLAFDQHRAMHEAVNHRMWDVTSGFTQWKINAAWPSVEWQIFDWYHKPMVSYYAIKRACEPVHVQMNLPDGVVSVINRRLEPQRGLHVSARVYDLQGRLRGEKTYQADITANAYHEVGAVPDPPDDAPVYFVRLDLADADGRLVSNNLYWLRAKGTGNYHTLNDIPEVALVRSCRLEAKGDEIVAHVTITNPTDRIALLVQLALTDERTGQELLPVIWSDNYVGLLPHESRELTARIPASTLAGETPRLEVGGWNVVGDVDCSALVASRTAVRPGETIKVDATLTHTFLDGSRVTLTLDGRPVMSRRAWARSGRTEQLSFPVRLDQPGDHTVRLGNRRLTLTVDRP